MAQIIEKAKSALGQHSGKSYTLVGDKVGSTGYGLMGLTWRADPQPASESIKTMKSSLDLGANFWNGGEIYGSAERNSLHLLNEYFTQYPEDAKKVVLSIKGGCDKGSLMPNGSEENVKRSIDECLAVLDGKKKLDIWQAARVDPKTPIEISMRTADEYVKAGKVGGVGLSECSAASIRRAAKITKIAAVEVEYSLWSMEIQDNGVMAACSELGIPVVAYSPLGRGFLTGQVKSLDDIPENDFRRLIPRFSAENFPKNMKLVSEIEGLAKRKGCTSGQIALAWVKAQSQRDGNPVIIPIPGTTTVARLHENLKDVDLGDKDLKEIDSILASFNPVGDRYGGHAAAVMFGDSPELKE